MCPCPLTFFSRPVTVSRVLRTAAPAAADAAAAQRAAKLRLPIGGAAVPSSTPALPCGSGVGVKRVLAREGGRFSKSISISSMPCGEGAERDACSQPCQCAVWAGACRKPFCKSGLAAGCCATAAQRG